MRLGTKILLMLADHDRHVATLAWIVTLNVTTYETRRDERISLAIERYLAQLEDHHRQVEKIVRRILEAPARARSFRPRMNPPILRASRPGRRSSGGPCRTRLEARTGFPPFTCWSTSRATCCSGSCHNDPAAGDRQQRATRSAGRSIRSSTRRTRSCGDTSRRPRDCSGDGGAAADAA